MSCCCSSAGRLFHSRGPATPKLLTPSLDCVRGIVHVWTSADQRCRRPTSVTSWQSLDRYGGARRWSDLYTSTKTLKSIRCLTGIQWSCLSTGVMCSRRPAPDRHKDTLTSVTRINKGKGQTLVIAPLSRQSHHRGAQVHGTHQAALHMPALNLPSRSRYSFTDPKRMEGWVIPGPGCKQQLTSGCYTTACGQRDSNPDLAIVSGAC